MLNLIHSVGFKVVRHSALVGGRLLRLIQLAVGVLAHKTHFTSTFLLQRSDVMIR